MASYIPGITDYVPQVQPFKPDLNFYSYALETKEAQYKQGYNKISGIYGSLLNSPILNNQTRERRDEFFKKAQQSIQKISEVDLSLNDNVQEAMQIFQPLVDDNYVASGIAKTKRYFNEASKAETLRNSTDPKTHSQYWNEGVADINYWAKDYSIAPMEEAVNFNDPRYVPYVDVFSGVFKDLKDAGLKMTRTGSSGGYIWTTTNGNQIVPHINEYLEATIGNDPAVQDMYGVKARVGHRNWVESNLINYGGDVNLAEDAYTGEVMRNVSSRQAQVEHSLKGKHKDIDTKIELQKKAIEQSGGVKSDNPLITSLNELLAQKQILNKSSEYNANISAAINPQTLLSADRQAKRTRIDSAVAGNLLSSDLFKMANAYAQATSEVDMKADPFAVSALNHQYAIEMENIRQGNRVKLAVAKGQLKNVERTPLTPDTNPLHQAGGAAVVNELDVDQKQRDKEKTDIYGAQTRVMTKVYDSLIHTATTDQDPNKRTDAQSMLNTYFPKEALAQAGNKVGGLAGSEMFQRAGHYYYDALVKGLDSPWVSQHYGDLKKEVNADIANSNLALATSTMNAHTRQTQKNNLEMLQWVHTAAPKDYVEMSQLIDTNGELVSASQFQGDDYQDALEKYTAFVNSSVNQNGKPIWRSWEGALPGGRAAGVMGGDLHPNDVSDANFIAKDLKGLVSRGEVEGFAKGIAPTSKEGFNLDPQVQVALDSYLTDLDNESRSPKGKKTAMGELWVHPIAANNNDLVAVTVKASHGYVNEQKNKKKQEGVNWDALEEGVTTLIKRENAPGFFKNFDKGYVSQLVNNGYPVTIDQFKNAGKFTIQKNPQGGLITTWERVVYDRETAKPTTKLEKAYPGNTVDADVIYQRALYEFLPAIDAENQYFSQISPAQRGPIKNYDDYLKQLGTSPSYTVPGNNQDQTEEE